MALPESNFSKNSNLFIKKEIRTYLKGNIDSLKNVYSERATRELKQPKSN